MQILFKVDFDQGFEGLRLSSFARVLGFIKFEGVRGFLGILSLGDSWKTSKGSKLPGFTKVSRSIFTKKAGLTHACETLSYSWLKNNLPRFVARLKKKWASKNTKSKHTEKLEENSVQKSWSSITSWIKATCYKQLSSNKLGPGVVKPSLKVDALSESTMPSIYEDILSMEYVCTTPVRASHDRHNIVSDAIDFAVNVTAEECVFVRDRDSVGAFGGQATRKKDKHGLLAKREKNVHHGIKLGVNIMVTRVRGQEGAEDNVAEKKESEGIYES
ncbi:hypothetical protein Tco_1196056 [Tanacetum coccineum]